MTMSTGQALLAILENDVLASIGQPLTTFVNAVAEAKNDPAKLMVAWLQFQGNLAPALLTFESTVSGQLISLFQGKINTFMGQVAAKAAQAGEQLSVGAPAAAAA